MKRLEYEYLVNKIFPLLNSKHIIDGCFETYTPPKDLDLRNCNIDAYFRGYDEDEKLFEFSLDYIDTTEGSCFRSEIEKFSAIDFINTQLPLLDGLLEDYLTECTEYSRVYKLTKSIFSIKSSCSDKVEKFRFLGIPDTAPDMWGRTMVELRLLDGLEEITVTMFDFVRIFDIETLKLEK